MEFFIIIALMIVAMYFFMIRPQRRRQQEMQQMQSNAGVGTRVITIGGLHGTIADVDDETVTLEVSPDVFCVFVRSAIARVLPEETDDADESDDADEDADSDESAVDDTLDAEIDADTDADRDQPADEPLTPERKSVTPKGRSDDKD